MAEPDDVRTRFTHLQLRATRVIIGDRRLTASARNVGVRINELVNFKYRYAWQSGKWLAGELGVTVRSVKRAVRSLVERGHFRVWRAGRRNRYVPCWLAEMEDAASKAVWEKTEAKIYHNQGTFLSPIDGGKSSIGDTTVPCSAPIGDSGVPCILDSQFRIPNAREGTPSPAPAAAGGVCPTTAGFSEAEKQRELPLVRSIDGGARERRENPHAAENAAHYRLDKGFRKALGDDYGALLDWLSEELVERALQAELSRHWSGVKLALEAWGHHSISPAASGETGKKSRAGKTTGLSGPPEAGEVTSRGNSKVREAGLAENAGEGAREALKAAGGG